LGTEGAGDHQHAYKDVFYSEVNKFPNFNLDTVGVPYSLGTSSGTDRDNVGIQMDRHTFNSGWHGHNLKGASGHSSANIAYAGGNQPFDNRPFFTVVQYIIYIQN